MRKFLELVGVVACILALSGSSHAEFYYSSGEQVPLALDSARVAIKFDPEAVFLHVMAAFPRLGGIEQDANMVDGFVSVSIDPGDGIYALLDSLNVTEGILSAEPYYHYANSGLAMPVGDRVVAGFDSLLSDVQVQQIVSANDLEILYEMEEMPNVFILRNSNPQGTRLLDAANQLYAQEGVEFSHPIFGVFPTRLGYKLFDRYSANQPHLKRTIGQFNVATVWDFAGVDDTLIVAVIDDGVITHEDLPSARILPGRDYATDTLSLPYDSYPLQPLVRHMGWHVLD
jgi:hypothetical protein